MADRAAALAALKAKRLAKDRPAPAPSYRRAAPSAPAPLAYKTSSASSAGAPPAASSSSPAAGAPPKILVLDSSSPAKPPPASSRNGAQARGALPPAPKRFYLDYDDGEVVPVVAPRGPSPAANAPLSSSPLASGSGGYFPRPDKRPGQSSLAKSRLGPGGAAGPSVIPLRLAGDGKVVDDLDDDDDDEFDSLDPYRATGGASSVASSRKLVRHNSAADSPLTGTPLSSRQGSPASQASTSLGLAAQFSDAFIDQDEATITRFANMFPAVSRSRVVKVLEQSGWEASVAADALLGMAPPPPPSALVDDDDDDEVVAVHSKSTSAIYAKRRTSDGDAREKKKKKRRHGGGGSDSGSGDDYGGESSSRRKSGLQKWSRDEDQEEEEALVWFNTCTQDELLSITACSPIQAASILALRPFDSTDDLRAKLTKRKGISPRLFDSYIEVMQGYHEVDAVLKGCEKVGRELERAMGAFMQLKEDENDARAGELSVVNVDIDVAQKLAEETDELRREALKGYLKEQPSTIAEGIVLKDYQLLGVNWLNLLYNRGLSCILADEMGLGKTIQVIAFLAHIKENDYEGPHLIIVPSSTLENWAREFARFCPALEVQTYYGTQAERYELGGQFLQDASDDKLDVILTTYQIASGTNKDDRKFLKRMKFQTAFFDEGHQLKNYKSARYKTLMDLPVDFRVLLTGTPLQNNLQELVSILNFILPDYFKDAEDSLRAIFKVSSDSHASLLSRQRVSRAQKMMKPFVLRRRKDQVLKDLPKKNLFVEYCPMTKGQAEIYRESEISSSRTLQTLAAETEKTKKRGAGLKGKDRVINNLEWDTGPSEKKIGDSGSNVLMNLRKAANHPLLFRSHYTDAKLKILAKDIMKEPEHMAKDYACIIEDMEIMTDAELDNLCKTFKSTRKHVLDREAFFDCGKITVLKRLIEDARAQGKRLLVFSMFTQVLDIIKRILNEWDIRWIKLTGETKVDERQGLVDQFTNDEDITVFLLSTLAGGMGINLTAASVVVIYDQGFNPHNEKQAADRSYRIGQTRDVEVYTLISTGTIDEDINDLALSKLALDAAVAGREDDGADGNATEAKAKSSLLSKLRTKLEVKLEGGQPETVREEGEGSGKETLAAAAIIDVDMEA